MGDERSAGSLHTTQVPGETSDGRRALVVVFPDGRWARFPLPAHGTTIIGRSHRSEVPLEHPSISRRHAALHLRAEHLEVEDLDSRNGTRIQGVKLRPGERVAVAAGQTLDVGSLLILVAGQPSAMPDPDEGRAAPGPRGEVKMLARDEVLTGSLEQIHRLVERIAPTDVTVLLLGETGVGKERLAEAIVRHSGRADGPFLKLNCAGLPESLVESELFGHERGAFSGAVAAKKGLFEACAGGTAFLDEIGELPQSVQAKLLRALESREVIPIGSVTPRVVDVRFIAATHRDLDAEVAAGRFRQDLYYRVNAFPIRIPPLRERRDEIESLAEEFAAEAAKKFGLPAAPSLSPEARGALREYSWPGNVRELRHVLERAVLLGGNSILSPEHIPLSRPTDAEPAARSPALHADPHENAERRQIVDALARCGGNQTRAARELGIARNTLIARMERHGLTRPRKRR